MSRGLLVLVLLAGCGEAVNTAAPPPAPAGPVRKPVKAVAAEAGEEYRYNPAGKRDPFQSFIKRAAADPIVGGLPALQRWDLDKYVLRGIIWNTQSPRALVVDPEGTGHPVKLGTYVGRNWGKVTSISDGCLVITEEYQTLDGELVVNPVTVCFPVEARK